MIKAILILMALLGLLMFALIVATATPTDREEYEAYLRYKERQKKHGESIRFYGREDDESTTDNYDCDNGDGLGN